MVVSSGAGAESTTRDPVSDPDSAPPGRSWRGSWKTWVPILLILLLGVGLRSVQYFGQVAMWHDEIAVARNVEDRGLMDLLTRPMDHLQIAPAGFLAILEATTRVLEVDEVALRLGPWLFSLASLLLFWRVAARFAEGAPLLAVLTLFAVSPALVWYGSSVKPYGSDVTISLLLVWLSLRHLERPDDRRRAWVAGVLGAPALLISFPAVPTAASLGALLGVGWWLRRPRSSPRPLLVLLFGWALGIALAGYIASSWLVSDSTDSFMGKVWGDSFPPADFPGALTWAGRSLYDIFAHLLVFFPPSNPVLLMIVVLPLLLATLGLVSLARRSWLRTAILWTPPVAGLAAATIHLLPFEQRLALHAGWPLLVFAGAGLQSLHGMITGPWRWMSRTVALVTALPLVAIVLLAARPPYEGPSGREVVEELATEIRHGDPIYVYTQGRHDMAFYGRRAGIEEWVQGERHYDDPRGYLRELDGLRGSPRVWFFWVDVDGNDIPEWIEQYLGTLGEELDRIPGDESGAVLYDLSDRPRWKATSPESFPLPGD